MPGAKLLLAALFAIALIWVVPTEQPPVNNLEPKAVQTAAAKQPLTNRDEHLAQTVAKAEKPVAQTPAVQPEPAAVATPEPEQLPVPGTHEELMAAAGIQPADYGAVDYIISHESSWNENATEPTTGAHGLPQALPYGKTGCGWSDSICQLRWASTYATDRYGSWWGAYDHWVANRWW